jgi:hypothetical protein
VASTTKTVSVALVAAIVGFVLSSLLHAYPKDVATRHRYCQLCAAYEETYEEGVILGGERGSKYEMGGALHDLLGPAVGEHEHDYTEWATIFPTFGVEAEHPEVAQRAQAIRVLDDSARAISTLEQAMRNDPDRTTRVVQALLDPATTAQHTADVLFALDRDAPWPERWTAVDAALASSD